MNKAFTANINDQVTARGYLDENDQLIMLEPEMGGGGDVAAVTGSVTVNGAYSTTPAMLLMVLFDSESEYIVPSNIALTAETPESLNVVKGSIVIIQNVISGVNITVSGNLETIDDDVYLVTGDFSVTCAYGE